MVGRRGSPEPAPVLLSAQRSVELRLDPRTLIGADATDARELRLDRRQRLRVLLPSPAPDRRSDVAKPEPSLIAKSLEAFLIRDRNLVGASTASDLGDSNHGHDNEACCRRGDDRDAGFRLAHDLGEAYGVSA